MIAIAATALVLVPGAILAATASNTTSAVTGVVRIATTGSVTLSKVPVVLGGTPSTLPALSPQKSMLGVNVTDVNYWSSERAFANLAVGSPWRDTMAPTWPNIPSGQIDRKDDLTSVVIGQQPGRVLITPMGAMTGTGVQIRCTWTGYAKVRIHGNISSLTTTANSAEFFWKTGPYLGALTAFIVTDWRASDPIKNLDCREKDLSSTALFAPEFLETLRPFGLVRYMKWSMAEENPAAITWANRTLAENTDQTGRDGVAIEHILALSNATKTDLWLTIPWNADEDYVRRYAQLVHDAIPVDRNVYVELSNEVWNTMYSAAKQAEAEGVAKNMGTAPLQSRMFRYAEKSKWMLNIWTQVFADRPRRLVRVVASQNPVPWTAETILSYKDTADYVDALSTAPYFGYDLLKGGETLSSVPGLMTLLSQKMSATMSGGTAESAKIAKKYGKRFIAYEAGQHVTSTSDATVPAAVNRNPAMYQIYKDYLTAWRTQHNDTIMLFVTKEKAGKGAFGLLEYPGQPASEAPKWRAVLDSQASFVTRDRATN